MAIARSQQIDISVARWYHCISRCVRRAFLLGDGEHDRKGWIEDRLEDLSQIFAIAVGGFSVMDNHLHVLLRLDPDVASGWSNEEVVRRWGRLLPARDRSRRPIPVTDEWVQWRLKDPRWVATARERLQSLSCFMKSLKEPLSRLANRQDKVTGAFWSITPGVSFVKESARSRRNWPASSIGWGVAPRAGGAGWRSSARVVIPAKSPRFDRGRRHRRDA